jgi:hypothetical protein
MDLIDGCFGVRDDDQTSTDQRFVHRVHIGSTSFATR